MRRLPMTSGLSTCSMSLQPAWDRFLRYVSKTNGQICYGDPILENNNADIDALAQEGKLRVKVLETQGSFLLNAKPTGDEDEVKELLGPLTPKDVSIVRCVGLNYRSHSEMAQVLSDVGSQLISDSP